MKKLSIVIPAYHEEKTIGELLDMVFSSPIPTGIEKEIIVVDDGSTDRTKEIVKEMMRMRTDNMLRLLEQPFNMGKGAALHRGIQEATGDYILIQDADLEYDPNEYSLLIEPVLKRKADVVYGSRFMGGNPHRVLFFWHSIGNKLLTFLSNMVSKVNLTDMETCYKLFRADLLKNIPLEEKRFGFEPEVTIKVCRIPNLKIYEVGISYHGRTYAEGKKINWRDGFRAIWCILKFGLFR